MLANTLARITAGIAGGLVVAFLGGILLPLTFEILPIRNNNQTGGQVMIFFALWAWGIIIAMRSGNALETCRTLLSASVLISLLFPLASLAYWFFFMDPDAILVVGPDDNEIRAGFVSRLAGILGAVLAAVFYVIKRVSATGLRRAGG